MLIITDHARAWEVCKQRQQEAVRRLTCRAMPSFFMRSSHCIFKQLKQCLVQTQLQLSITTTAWRRSGPKTASGTLRECAKSSPAKSTASASTDFHNRTIVKRIKCGCRRRATRGSAAGTNVHLQSRRLLRPLLLQLSMRKLQLSPLHHQEHQLML